MQFQNNWQFMAKSIAIIHKQNYNSNINLVGFF